MEFRHPICLHSEMWKILGRKDIFVQKLKVFDALSSHSFTKKKYRVLNERVKNIISVYDDKSDLLLEHYLAWAKPM